MACLVWKLWYNAINSNGNGMISSQNQLDVNINPNDTMIKLITIIIERMSFLTSIENTIV